MAVAESVVLKNIMKDMDKRKTSIKKLISDLVHVREDIAELIRRAPNSPADRQRIAKLERETGSDIRELVKRISADIERLCTGLKTLRESFAQGANPGKAAPKPPKKKAAPIPGRKFI
jgi:DNA-binding ferritin-like protein